MPKVKRDTSFFEYVNDLFVDIPGITTKTMFGGWGFYKDGIIFAIITDNQLYFKVDDTNRPEYEELGSNPFVFSKKKQNQQVTLSYWLLPEEIMEDRDRLGEWVEKSVEVSKETKH